MVRGMTIRPPRTIGICLGGCEVGDVHVDGVGVVALVVIRLVIIDVVISLRPRA